MSVVTHTGRAPGTHQRNVLLRLGPTGRVLTPGILAAVVVAAAALGLARVVPLVGAPVLALTLGIGAAAVRTPAASARPGVRWSSRYVLQSAIVILGLTLSLARVASVGLRTLPVMLGTLTAALVVALLVGRALGIPGTLRTLVGVGTGICGASAIAAVSGVIEASEVDIAYAMSTIFVFNLIAVLLFPPIGHLLGLSQSGFGLWAGTAVNDTSSVVATGYAFGHAAGVQSVIVKVTRTTMIIPVVAVLGVLARRGDAGRTAHWHRVVPWFLVWFVFAAVLESVGMVPDAWRAPLAGLAVVLITVALAAIGLSTHLGEMRRAGYRPLMLGTLTWMTVAITGLVLQFAVGSW
jgi:uncharacterized integral membrane protein (TIGR00698 family)